jgi:hypothetical protein
MIGGVAAVRYAVALVLAAHGIAHLPGFAVAWRLMSSPELPYSTLLLMGRLDVGDAGMRVVGILWLALALTFIALGVTLWMRPSLPAMTALAVTAMSLALSLLQWPAARIGVAVNVLLLVVLPSLKLLR